MSPPPPTMPSPSRRPALPVRRFVIVDAAHAARMFPGPDLDRERRAICEEIERSGGAVLVLARGLCVDRVLTLDNGAEIAGATGSITGAVAFQIERLPTEPPPASLPAPLSRETSIAEAEVEIARLRRVEDAARTLSALLSDLHRCG